jgi:excisionase family DNA binding protein
MQAPADIKDEILTIEELSDYLKISKSSLYKLAQDSRIPGQKVGRHWRFRKVLIDGWLEGDEQKVRRSGRGE